jgi:hypothetical protein
MSRRSALIHRVFTTALATLALVAPPQSIQAQQKNDEEYTKQIKQFMRDPRITTELVDHLPASSTVPTPLKGFGHIIGAWGVLDKSEDMNKYLASIAKAAPARAKYWTIGKSEEGRDMSVLVVGSEDIIRNLDKYREQLALLTDPRKTTEAQARALIKTAKPIYWITSGMHSPETGGPEMLMELAYRLVVEETPFIQSIRNNVITIITPVVETDGRDKVVDAYNYSKAHPGVSRNNLMMYWGKYVQHDNNRDGMGQFLQLTRNIEKFGNEWHPTILHDLHEAQTLLYASTGTGPYNDQLDPITIDEWWTLAENDVLEMTKRGVPGVWTYGFYDGWVPNYMFFVAHAHNAIGRFYEVQSYGPDTSTVRINQSKEWFRPNPTPAVVAWGPRSNTNIQESAILFALNRVARDRDTYLENYWLKNKRSVEGHRRPDVWLGDSRRAAPQGGRRRRGERVARPGARVPDGERGVQGGRCRREGGRLHRAWRPAVSHRRRHLLRAAAVPEGQSGAVRRYRMDVPVPARPRDHADHRQERARAANDAGEGTRHGRGRRHRYRTGDRRRAHGRQQHHHLPLQAEGRQDGRGRR